MRDDAEIRPEREPDQEAVREVHTRAFADAGRVAALADGLRVAAAPVAALSFVATARDRVVGHVMLSAGRLDAPLRLLDVYVLSPLGVLPGFQRRGLGTALIREALAAATRRAMPLVFLEGSPAYYGNRGFERADAIGFRAPSLRIPPAAFQVARLAGYQPWMTGTLVYSETFWAHDWVGLRPPAGAPPPH